MAPNAPVGVMTSHFRDEKVPGQGGRPSNRIAADLPAARGDQQHEQGFRGIEILIYST